MRVRQRGGAVVRQLRALYNIGAIGALTDGQLLERFATDADEAAELAFSALVERHESMVWHVCRAILRDDHEADDAFQATFLVLVRKARSLWVRDSIGPWLHHVAWRTAMVLRRSSMRQRKHEQRSQERQAPRYVAFDRQPDYDRDAAIHEEVNRLPDKYRVPIVLCDLQGRSHQEAARCLGWPVGTVKSRQSHGRGLIRDRLERRGIGLAMAGAIVESLRQTTFAAVPQDLSRRAINGAMQHSARISTTSAISAQVLSATREVLRSIAWVQYRMLAAAALAIGIVSGGATLSVMNSSADDRNPSISRPATSTPAHAPQPGKVSKPAVPPEPGTPQARLLAQQLATRKARAHYEIAKSTRELAEIALQEYDELTYPRDLVVVDGEVKLADVDLKRAEDRLDWARRMFDKGYVSKATKASEEASLQKAKFSIEQAASKKRVLADYTRAKNLKELRAQVAKARSDENAERDALEIQKVKELEMERQLGRGAG